MPRELGLVPGVTVWGKGPCLGFAVDAYFRVCQKLTEKW